VRRLAVGCFVSADRHARGVRAAYRCRAYPDPAQQAMLNRTFGCVRKVWNTTLDSHYTRSAFTMRDGELRLAKTDGPLRFVWSWPDVDVAALNPTMVVVSREPDARCYVTFAIDTQAPEPLPATGRAVGIDLGINDFAVTSDGEKIANPRLLERKARSLARYQRRLARVISDCGWGEFRRQLEYKCQRYGRRLVVIDRWYPSSKTCSACGHLLATLGIGTRQWTCPSCGARHDRDINAAKNILAAGQAVTACGADVRHSGTSRVQSAVKQEPRPVTAGIPIFQAGSSQDGLRRASWAASAACRTSASEPERYTRPVAPIIR
jgi:putative transposase